MTKKLKPKEIDILISIKSRGKLPERAGRKFLFVSTTKRRSGEWIVKDQELKKLVDSGYLDSNYIITELGLSCIALCYR